MSCYQYYPAPDVPAEAAGQELEDGTVIAFDYDCYLLERETARGYTYTAQNCIDSRKLKLCSRRDMAMEDDVHAMMNLIRMSNIAGIGKLQADRPIGGAISIVKASEILEKALCTYLPRYGCNIGAEQRKLAHAALDTLIRHEMVPVEAESNELDIFCCLIAAIIAKRGRMNDFHARGMYPEMQYADMPKLPVVISVPDMKLQKKIAREWLPKISEILFECGIIGEALTFVEQKGRENYACPIKLKNWLPSFRHANRHKALDKMLKRGDLIDLSDIRGIMDRERHALSVDSGCSSSCPKHSGCGYIKHIETANSYGLDIHVCTHGYMLADTRKRMNGKRLMPNYQSLIVCDAYNCLKTAVDMFRIELPALEIQDAMKAVYRLSLRRRGLNDIAIDMVGKISKENMRMFRWLVGRCGQEGGETYSIVTLSNDAITRHLKNIRNIADRLIYVLYEEAFYAKAEELLAWVNIKYGANITAINLNDLLSGPMSDKDNRKEQLRKLVGVILSLSAVKRCLATEKATKQKKMHDASTARMPYARYSHNTEREAIGNLHSDIKALVWEQGNLMLKKNVATGYRSTEIIEAVKAVKAIRNKAAEITKKGKYHCRVSIESETSRLHAIPKDLGEKVFAHQHKRKIPIILMSGKLPEDVGFDGFERTLGIY